MNELPVPIEVNEEWTFSKWELKHFFHTDDLEPTFKTKSIKQFPGILYKFAIGAEFDENEENPDVAIYFTLLNMKENEKYRADLLFRVKSAGFSTLYSTATFNSEKYHLYGIICSKDALFNREKKFFVNNVFTVEMKGVLYVEPSDNEILQKGLGQFLWSNDDRDFVISVGKEDKLKKEIEVHKCVLASRSPVFDRMMKTHMKEKLEGKVEIIDFKYDTVKAAIAFFYDQDISQFLKKNFPTNAFSLLKFGDKYDINDLTEIAENFLAKSVSPLNIVKLTNAAIENRSSKMEEYFFTHLLVFSKQDIPVENYKSLNQYVACKVFEEDL